MKKNTNFSDVERSTGHKKFFNFSFILFFQQKYYLEFFEYFTF